MKIKQIKREQWQENSVVDILQLIKKQFSDIPEKEKRFFSDFSEQHISHLYSSAYEMYRNGKYGESKQFFRFLVLLNASDRRFWMGMGACYQMLKEYQAAIECYSVAAVQNPKDPYVHQYAADCFFAQNEIKMAIQTLQSAISAAVENGDKMLVEKLKIVEKAWKIKELR
jgi:secretion system chaperone SscA